MKRFAYLTLLLLAAATPALAQDISIRPANNNGNPPASVNYGMKAKPTAPAVQPQVHTPVAPVSAPAAPVIVPEQPPRQVYNPPPSYTPSQTSGGAEVIKVSASHAKIPSGNGQNILNIGIQPGAIGVNDLNSVRGTLGLQDSELKSNCYFEYDVMLNTGPNIGDFLPLGGATSFQYRHNGGIEGLSVFPTIACRAVKQPVSGLIIEQGGYYKLAMSSVTCPPPGNAASVNFRYLGDGKGSCEYR